MSEQTAINGRSMNDVVQESSEKKAKCLKNKFLKLLLIDNKSATQSLTI